MRACHNSEVEVKHISNFDTKVLNYINYFTDRVKLTEFKQILIFSCQSWNSVGRLYVAIFFYSVFSVNKPKKRSENNSFS